MTRFGLSALALPVLASVVQGASLPNNRPAYCSSSEWVHDGIIADMHLPGISCYVQSVCADELKKPDTTTQVVTATTVIPTESRSTSVQTVFVTSVATEYFSATETDYFTSSTLTISETVGTDTVYTAATSIETDIVSTETETIFTATETDQVTVATQMLTSVTGTDVSTLVVATDTVLETAVDTATATISDHATITSLSINLQTITVTNTRTITESETTTVTISTELVVKRQERRAATSSLTFQDKWISEYGEDHLRSACSCVIKSSPTASTTTVATATSYTTIYTTLQPAAAATTTIAVYSTVSSAVLLQTEVGAIATIIAYETATVTETYTVYLTVSQIATATLELASTVVQSVTASTTLEVGKTVTSGVTATVTDTLSSTRTIDTFVTKTTQVVEETDVTVTATASALTTETDIVATVSTTIYTATSSTTAPVCSSTSDVDGDFEGASSAWTLGTEVLIESNTNNAFTTPYGSYFVVMYGARATTRTMSQAISGVSPSATLSYAYRLHVSAITPVQSCTMSFTYAGIIVSTQTFTYTNYAAANLAWQTVSQPLVGAANSGTLSISWTCNTYATGIFDLTLDNVFVVSDCSAP